MNELKDICTRADIELLVNEFYVLVKKDDLLGEVFNNEQSFDWGKHIPVMYSFWETILLHNASYKGNPVLTHVNLNKRYPLTQQHFDRWREIFFNIIDSNFFGEVANNAKLRVELMEKLMIIKIKDSENPNFIQ